MPFYGYHQVIQGFLALPFIHPWLIAAVMRLLKAETCATNRRNNGGVCLLRAESREGTSEQGVSGGRGMYDVGHIYMCLSCPTY
jgi:hypothetical protein